MIHKFPFKQHCNLMFAFISATLVFFYSSLIAQTKMIKVQVTPADELAIVVDPDIHDDYGLAYPMTYVITYPSGTKPLTASYRYSSADNWNELSVKTSSDYFNGIEAVRFEDSENTAYISVPFSEAGDSVYVRLSTTAGDNISPTYKGIAKYYDNRTAMVTASADDWHQWFDPAFKQTLAKFRFYKIPVTVGIVTDETTTYTNSPWMTSATWASVQTQLDSGYVEAASHSRNHLHVEYPNKDYEVKGSRDDISAKLVLPAQYRKGDKEYVYIWIAPYGEYSAATKSVVENSMYLVSRLYQSVGEDVTSTWNDANQMFNPINLTVEIGAPSWGGGETDPAVLKGLFDKAYNKGGVYHIMCHPQELVNDWVNETYLDEHFAYISQRNDIWYATLGHLYLYQLLYQNSQVATSVREEHTSELPTKFRLKQNYPNPFNPTTTIRYSGQKAGFVQLFIYDELGRLVRKLVNGNQYAGEHFAIWNGKNDRGEPVSNGIYFYKLNVDGKDFAATRMLLLK